MPARSAIPKAFGLTRPRTSTGSSRRRRSSIPAQGAYGRWFTGAVVNTCYNALDRQVLAGRADQVALIHDSPLTNSVSKFTYRQMLDEVKTLAAVIRDFGVNKGDRVIIYMPLVPEAVIAMLACARIGAVHSVVFGGFAAKELATRIDDAAPKLVLSASCGIEPGRIVQYKPLLDEAIRLAKTKPQNCLILQRPQHPAIWSAAATTTGRRLAPGRSPRTRPPSACRCSRPIRSTCSTPQAPRACRRAWCATMAVISFR